MSKKVCEQLGLAMDGHRLTSAGTVSRGRSVPYVALVMDNGHSQPG